MSLPTIFGRKTHGGKNHGVVEFKEKPKGIERAKALVIFLDSEERALGPTQCRTIILFKIPIASSFI